MSTFETHATASHRYYMRKTKAEIVQRIRDMLGLVTIPYAKTVYPRDGGAAYGYPRRVLSYMVNNFFPDSWVAKHSSKDELASAAMLAHDLLGRVQAMPELTSCAADCDDMCDHPKCPQNRDGEPAKTGRHCPLHDPAWRDGDD